MLFRLTQLFCVSFNDATRFHFNFVLPKRRLMKLDTSTRHELNNTGVNRLQNPHVLPIFGEFSIIIRPILLKLLANISSRCNEDITYFHEIPKPHL